MLQLPGQNPLQYITFVTWNRVLAVAARWVYIDGYHGWIDRTVKYTELLQSYMTLPPYSDISLADLDRLRQQPDMAVIDVRDEWEFEEFNLGGLNIPLPDIRARKAELLAYRSLIVICTNGARSRIAAKDLLRQSELRDKTIYHVRGGIIESED